MRWIDTHCHIHSSDYPLDVEQVLNNAKKSQITDVITCGSDVKDSKLAIELAEKSKNVWAAVGVHPHEADKSLEKLSNIDDLTKNQSVIAIGECGLDYWYEFSNRGHQKDMLKYQMELANKLDLPLVLHIRASKNDPFDAFLDFYEIFDQYSNLTGVVHSFTSGQQQLEGVLSRGLFVGLNGIITFASEQQNSILSDIPIDKILLETDAPYLTPTPKRGKVNEPENLVLTAEYLAKKIGVSINELSEVTTTNASKLFGI